MPNLDWSTLDLYFNLPNLNFFFFLGGGRGFYLRSVAPSAPKPPPSPLHVSGVR